MYNTESKARETFEVDSGEAASGDNDMAQAEPAVRLGAREGPGT